MPTPDDLNRLRHRKPKRNCADVIIVELNQASFGRNLRGAARGLWRGEIDAGSFFEQYLLALERGFEEAWTEGARTCGIQPNERSEEENDRLNQFILEQAGFVPRLADWIEENSRANKGKWGAVSYRLTMWENRYGELVGIAQQMACADSKLRWRRSPDSDSCEDCLRMDGRIYRASVWDRYAIRPKTRDLACGGYRCNCVFEQTEEPLTPGRPPSLVGMR